MRKGQTSIQARQSGFHSDILHDTHNYLVSLHEDLNYELTHIVQEIWTVRLEVLFLMEYHPAVL